MSHRGRGGRPRFRDAADYDRSAIVIARPPSAQPVADAAKAPVVSIMTPIMAPVVMKPVAVAVPAQPTAEPAQKRADKQEKPGKNDKTSRGGQSAKSNQVAPQTLIGATAEEAVVKPYALPAHTHVLVNQELKVSSTEFDKCLQENRDFSVIGVCGTQSSGKSTLLSRFSRDAFPIASPETLSSTMSHTLGILAHITTERVILLDSQPLLTHDPAFDLMLVLALLQTCHVVMVVFETEQEAQSLAKLFRTAVTLQPMISSEIPFSSNSESFSLPKIVLVANKVPVHRFNEEYAQKLWHLFSANQCDGIQLNRTICNFPGPSVFLMPLLLNGSTVDSKDPIHHAKLQQFNQHARQLVTLVRVTPKQNQAAGRVTERDWLSYFSKMWRELPAAPTIGDLLQSA